MYGLNRMLSLSLALSISTVCLAERKPIVDHHDPISINPDLSLSTLLAKTLEKYPDAALWPALQQQAEALKNRGDSWLAGSLTASINYLDDSVADDLGNREIEGGIEIPLWNWGQREAGQKLADHAQQDNASRQAFMQLQVAGLLRTALWDMQLQNNRYDIAQEIFSHTKKLVNTVKRRVELGDLPRVDLLLAQAELLEKRSALVRAEAELMHARKRFSRLTQATEIPGDFREQQAKLSEINQYHPVLAQMDAQIAQQKARLYWIKLSGSGQTTLAIGGKSERGSRNEKDANTITFSLSVPFGGEAHLAPEIASGNLKLTQSVVKRNHLYRQLEQDFHEAEHALEVDHTELEIAKQRREIAKDHLKMTQLSFNAGEINLMDLLRVQSLSYAAIQHASEQEIIFQRDIALFNQAVGKLP